MVTRDPAARLALARTVGRTDVHGAWWPRGRVLEREVVGLFLAWPPEEGLICRVDYWPPDWTDAPVAVAVPGRRGPLRLGHLSSRHPHRVVLRLLDGQRRLLSLVPSTVPLAVGVRRLDAIRRPPPDPHAPRRMDR